MRHRQERAVAEGQKCSREPEINKPAARMIKGKRFDIAEAEDEAYGHHNFEESQEIKLVSVVAHGRDQRERDGFEGFK